MWVPYLLLALWILILGSKQNMHTRLWDDITTFVTISDTRCFETIRQHISCVYNGCSRAVSFILYSSFTIHIRKEDRSIQHVNTACEYSTWMSKAYAAIDNERLQWCCLFYIVKCCKNWKCINNYWRAWQSIQHWFAMKFWVRFPIKPKIFS